MDVVLHAQFQRVEAALSTLVESIASYNPSPQAALDLVAADDELSHGLDELARHQANHARILALRAEDQALESQLKASISALADLRHELLETPATAFSDDSRPVPFDELLQFAKNIAKYTVPPTYRERPPKDDDEDKPNNDISSGPVSSNGLGTPAIAHAPAGGEEPAKDGLPAPAVGGDGEAPNPAPEQDDWLTQLQKDKGRVWFPWPTDDKIHAGNLMRIQSLLDEGKNPEEINIHDEAEKEQKRLEEEQQRQEAAMAAQEPQMPSAEPANPTRAAPRPAQAPEVFAGFEDFDDD